MKNYFALTYDIAQALFFQLHFSLCDFLFSLSTKYIKNYINFWFDSFSSMDHA